MRLKRGLRFTFPSSEVRRDESEGLTLLRQSRGSSGPTVEKRGVSVESGKEWRCRIDLWRFGSVETWLRRGGRSTQVRFLSQDDKTPCERVSHRATKREGQSQDDKTGSGLSSVRVNTLLRDCLSVL